MVLAQQPASTQQNRFARIAILRPHDGATIDFEAGYIRHLEWHRQAKDPWAWYGWTVWAGERQRWFVYATFGHAAADFDAPIAPADDERDNVSNVTPHASFVGNALYEFLPAMSRGSGVPTPLPRLELLTVELRPGTSAAFETAMIATVRASRNETLWFRMIAGGAVPQYVRLRPSSSVNTIVVASAEAALPASVNDLVLKSTAEILNLRPAMSYGLAIAPPQER
jgi:hypothetical protein